MNSVGMYVTSMQTLCDCSNMLAVFANIVIVISSVMFKNCLRNSHFSFMAGGLLGKNGVLDQSLSLCRWGSYSFDPHFHYDYHISKVSNKLMICC